MIQWKYQMAAANNKNLGKTLVGLQVTWAKFRKQTRRIEIAAQIFRFGFVSNSFIWFGHAATL